MGMAQAHIPAAAFNDIHRSIFLCTSLVLLVIEREGPFARVWFQYVAELYASLGLLTFQKVLFWVAETCLTKVVQFWVRDTLGGSLCLRVLGNTQPWGSLMSVCSSFWATLNLEALCVSNMYHWCVCWCSCVCGDVCSNILHLPCWETVWEKPLMGNRAGWDGAIV